MSIVTCPECNEHYTTQTICPHCGFTLQNKPNKPIKRKRKPSRKVKPKNALDVKNALDMQFRRSKKDKLTFDFLSLIETRQKSLLATMKPEHVFDTRAANRRLWRVDFVILDLKIAIELEGGVWTGGRHTRGSGFIEDCNKYNQLALQGWLLLRYTREHIDNQQAQIMAEIRNAIRVRKEFNSLLDIA